MSDISERYRRNADAFLTKVDAVGEEEWSSPTPCEEWTVRDLVGHVVSTSGMFFGFIGEDAPPGPSVEDDPAAAVRAATGAVHAALEDPDRAGRSYDGMFGTTTFEASVDRFLSADLVVHGWDLARATGQDDGMDEAEVAVIREAMSGFDTNAMRGPGAFGPEVDVPDDASEQDRLLAFLGRRP